MGISSTHEYLITLVSFVEKAASWFAFVSVKDHSRMYIVRLFPGFHCFPDLCLYQYQSFKTTD